MVLPNMMTNRLLLFPAPIALISFRHPDVFFGIWPECCRRPWLGAQEAESDFDLYFDAHRDTLAWGRKKVRVTIEYPR